MGYYSSSSRWDMEDHIMKEQHPLAVTIVLKGKKKSETASREMTQREKLLLKAWVLYLGLMLALGCSLLYPS